MPNARPKSILETKFVENYKEGIVLEGFPYPEDNFNESDALTTTWKELSDRKPVRISSIYEDYSMALQDLREEMDLASSWKVASFTRGEPIIYFVRPDDMSSLSGYIIAWVEKNNEETEGGAEAEDAKSGDEEEEAPEEDDEGS